MKRVVVVAFAYVVFVANLLHPVSSKPNDALKDLADRFWQWRLREFPEQATIDGFHQHDDKLESYSLDAFDRRWNKCYALLIEAQDIKAVNLSIDDRLTLNVLKNQLQTYIDGYRWKDYGNLNPISFLEGLHRATDWIHKAKFQTTTDYEKYLTRLNALPFQVEEIKNLLYKAIELGRTNHEVSMIGVEEALGSLSNVPPEATVFYHPYHSKQLDSLRVPPYVRQNLKAGGVKAIRERVQPAIKRLKHYLATDYAASTRKSYGVNTLENGTEYYKSVLRWHLSVNMDPMEVHQLGHTEVARIKTEMKRVMAWLGYHGDLKGFFIELQQRQEFYNHTEVQLLDEYKKTIYQRIQPRLPMLFSNLKHLPNITVKKTHTDGIEAYYLSNSLWANTRRPETRSSFTILPVTLHEAVPGHHMQIALARQQNVADFRKYIAGGRKYSAPFHFPYYTAYAEGWGLYSEYLGEEMGLYDNPYEQFGRYCFEMFRACRLVVDTGIHYLGWSKDEAVEYLANHTILPQQQIEKEVNRYITWPGQACAYKVGELKIKELRRKAEQALGRHFSVKDFHDQILKVGAVPLDILESFIEEWIQNRMPSTGLQLTNFHLAVLIFMSMTRTLLL